MKLKGADTGIGPDKIKNVEYTEILNEQRELVGKDKNKVNVQTSRSSF